MEKLLNSILTVAPLIQKTYIYDCTVVVTDTEKYVGYFPGEKLGLKIEVGGTLREGGINNTVIKTGKQILSTVSKEVYGIPYITCCYPLIEDNKIIGCFSTCIPTDREELIIQIANQLSLVSNNIISNTEILTNSSIELESTCNEVNKLTKVVRNKVEESSNITTSINKISSQSNILGLNASIEAARAGSHGRGFAIVANEIRKLSDYTSQSATSISNHLTEVTELINKVSQDIENTNNFTIEQTAGIQELSSVTNRLQEMIMNLRDLAKSYNPEEWNNK